MLAGLMALHLSRDPAIAGLIRVSLLGALGSSPLALAETLGRYRSLLLHAIDATASGKSLSRRTIRQFTGAELEQLVFWPLVAEPDPGVELALDDLDRVRELEASAKLQARGLDPKARVLRALTGDSKRTLVFTNARATVRYLRNQLGSGIAWCTGDRAGIDGLEVPRDDVLALFRPSDGLPEHRRPRILLATDVAAEGLDLPLVARVVHYDLPWTPVRLEQRTGRAFRLGSLHVSVEVVRLLPPGGLDRFLRREEVLARKGVLPLRLGLHEAADAPWRLRARIALAWSAECPGTGVAEVRGAPGFVACVRIRLSNGQDEEFILARQGGGWLGDAAAIAGLLEAARHSAERSVPNPRLVARAATLIARVTRHRLRALRTGTLAPVRRIPGFAALSRNLTRLGREGSRNRDGEVLALAQRGLRWLHRGHTVGDCLRIQRWSRLTWRELRDRLATVPDPAPAPSVVGVDLPALLILSPPGRPR
jgi:hypothetical protein